jgi:3-oxoacyl-[acyl-carrier-protein] synthase II
MLASERRVVITGIGLVTPLGIGSEAVGSALAQGRGAVSRIQSFPVGDLPNDSGAEVRNFDLKVLAIPKHRKALIKNTKYMARDIALAVGAAEQALIDAGLADGGVDPTRFGVDLGAGLISTELDEVAPAIDVATTSDGRFDFPTWGRDSIPQIIPIWLLRYLPNMLACHISILNDCQGPSNTITQGDAASSVAIGEATRIIERARADVMISGGADSKIHPLSLVRMALFGVLSHHRDDPSRACRPFDRTRDGWVPGEGAGILILEELEHAKARGARIHGEILGFGSGCDASPSWGLDPEGKGTEIAIRAALQDAGLEPGQVGHVNAHGAATLVGDLAEARALERIFGAEGVPVTALKGHMGNLASGCGAVELLCSLIGVNQGQIPPTINCDDMDPECRIDLVRQAPRPTDNPVFVTTNVTRHGQAAALVVRGNPSGGIDL